jgi:putative flippase GtrA
MSVGDLELGLPARRGGLRRLIDRLPRPLRFLGVGGVGLLTDLTVFTAVMALSPHPLAIRLVSLAVATVVTWRLNRALTFARSGRRPHAEAVRYVLVTLVAQGISYAVFAALVIAVAARLPQAAVIAGAAVGALVSYNGHRLFAFSPQRPEPSA